LSRGVGLKAFSKSLTRAKKKKKEK